MIELKNLTVFLFENKRQDIFSFTAHLSIVLIFIFICAYLTTKGWNKYWIFSFHEILNVVFEVIDKLKVYVALNEVSTINYSIVV